MGLPRAPGLHLLAAVGLALAAATLTARRDALLVGPAWLLLTDAPWSVDVEAAGGAPRRITVAASGGDPCLAPCLLAPLGDPMTLLGGGLAAVAFWRADPWRALAGCLLAVEGLHLWSVAKGAAYAAGTWTTAPTGLHVAGSLLVGLALGPVDPPLGAAVSAAFLALFPVYGFDAGTPVAYPVAVLDPHLAPAVAAGLVGLAAVIAWRFTHVAELDADAERP